MNFSQKVSIYKRDGRTVSIIKNIDPITNEVTNTFNKTIEINDIGISSGMGIKKINSNIDFNTLNTSVIVISIPTAIEIKVSDEKK